MFTIEDIEILEVSTPNRFHTINLVKINDRIFNIGGLSVQSSDMDDLIDEDPNEALELIFGASPVDSYVIELVDDGLGNLRPKYECNEDCASGLCQKRLASDNNVGSIERAREMLLLALNS